MEHEQNELSVSLTKTIAQSELPSVAADIVDAAVGLPIISSIRGIWKGGGTIKDGILLRKLAVFLSDLSTIPQAKRQRMLAKLQKADTAEDVGEKLLILLDRLESTQKARLLAKALAAYMTETITGDEFWRVSFILDRVPLSDIRALKEWGSLDLNTVEHVRKHLYLAAGLGWWVENLSSTGFQWQERLCTIFADHLLSA